MSRRVKTKYSYKEVLHAFQVFDSLSSTVKKKEEKFMKDDPDTAPMENFLSGKIHVDILLKALTTYCDNNLDKVEANELLNQLEPDSNGFIHYTDYVDLMSNGY